MNCPRCSSDKRNKDGFVKGVQRYKCKECSYKYTVELKSTAKPKSMKKQALHLYLEGLGFRSIGRILDVSNVSVMNWIRSFGEEIASLRTEETSVEIVEMDEMHSFIGSKKTTAGFGLLLIDLGKDSSISLLATGETKRRGNSGIRLSITR